MVDSDYVEIRYSLQLMTSLWRHICKYDLQTEHSLILQHISTTDN